MFILFQQEIRRFLSLLGRVSTVNELPKLLLGRFRGDQLELWDQIDQILGALQAMSAENIGSLIVFSPDDPLDYYAETGDYLDAVVSKRLLISIFYNKNPLHDGALIIHKDRIKAARCRLPISDSDSIPASLGMRHRAALGMSEQSNALVLLSSEETGQMSVIHQGRLHKNLALPQIRKIMKNYLQNTHKMLEDTPKEEEEKYS